MYRWMDEWMDVYVYGCSYGRDNTSYLVADIICNITKMGVNTIPALQIHST